MIASVRRKYVQIDPADLPTCVARGDLLVDIRPSHQRSRDGALPHAVVIDRNVLEWRLDPTCEFALPTALTSDRIVIVCNEGYGSTLAVATLRELQVKNVSDVAGGYQALLATGTIARLATSAPPNPAEDP